MKKALKILGILIGIIVLLLLAGGIFINARGIPSYEVKAPQVNIQPDSAMVANGARLVNMVCAECHRGENTRALTGKKLMDIPEFFGEIYSPNITQHPEHGMGKYTAGELTYLLRTGIKRNGDFAPTYMPRFNHMSEYDMNSIIAYLQSDEGPVQPVAEPSQPCQPSFMTKFLCNTVFKPLPFPEEYPKKPAASEEVALGKYILQGMVNCYECHSADFKTNNQLIPEESVGYLGGGNRLLDLDGNIVLAPNLTMHETGLGGWTEEQFIQAVKYGQRPDGKAIRYPMLKLSQLADEEVSAMWAYLQTVPKIDNAVLREKIE